MLKRISKFLVAALVFQTVATAFVCPVKVSAASAGVPLMNLESVGNNSYISDKVQVKGWALLPSGVNSVSVSVDNNNLGTVSPCERSDVLSVYPAYKTNNPTPGYNTYFDVTKLTVGSHILKVNVTGNNSSETESSTITILKAAPQMYLDTVPNGLTVSGSLQAKGWAVNASGIAKVNYYIDSTLIKTALPSSFTSRSDVYRSVDLNGYYNYKGSLNSGFDDDINVSTVSGGTHTFTAEAVGYDGQSTKVSRTVYITKPASLMNLESVGNNSYISDSIYVKGWALLPNGVSSVSVYFDNNFIGTASSVVRSDVSAYYPAYTANNTNSGFVLNAKLDLSKYAVGNHTLKIVVNGKDSTETISSTRNVKKAAPQMYLDTVQNYGTYMGSVRFKGWAVNASGISKINYYIDGAFRKATLPSSFVSRSDVYSIIDKSGYYNYKGADKSGFDDWVDVSGITGTHTVTVEAVGYDGQSTKTTRTIYVIASQSRLVVDSPSSDAYYLKSSMEFSGWALIPAGVSSMKVRIDGTEVPSSAAYKYRSDVDYCYPSYTASNPNAGYDIKVDMDESTYNKYSLGSHSVVITAYGKDGSKIEHAITMQKAAPRLSIDRPLSGQNFSYKDSIINVSGWATNTSGIKEVDLYINGVLKQSIVTASTPLSRRDDIEILIDRYGAVGYKDADHSGYSFSTDISNLGYGSNNIRVKAIGYDGTSVESDIDFIKAHTTYTHYNISEGQLVSCNAADISKYCDGYALTNSDVDPDSLINKNIANSYDFLNLDFVNVSAAGLNQMLSGCGYLDGQGQTFLNAGYKYNVNPVYLAAHALWETGYGTSKLSKGENPQGTYIGYFNMFGYGAVDWDPVNGGNSYAVKHNWNSPEAAIMGGAQVISYNYIHNSQIAGHYDQDTLYTMKWDPEGTVRHGTMGTEYASDYNWPNGIAHIINRYSYLFNGQQLNFDVPTYN